MNKNPVGEIITFYSFKGGVGRSMALANVACLISLNKVGSNILMIDWDLEAPGLHQFFRGRFETVDGITRQLPNGQLGLIDLFYELRTLLSMYQPEDEISDEIFAQINIEKYTIKVNDPSLILMPAGRFGDGLYSMRVNNFDWADFFDRYPGIITGFANYLRKKYHYILVDSRTGYTDTGGICTSIMPEKIVAMFVPNRQSISGLSEVMRRATEYRKQSDDLRPLLVFPLISRVENAEFNLQTDWRSGNPVKGIEEGYQLKLESILKSIYNLRECDLTEYFNQYQLQYVPYYSYGEELAVLGNRSEERLSLAHSFEKFTSRLLSGETPWEKSGSTDREPSINFMEIKRISPFASKTIFQTGLSFLVAALIFFFYYFGSSLGLFQILYEFINWQYFDVAIIMWLLIDFLWVFRWKSLLERIGKLLNKPWIFTEDSTPQNVPIYPRVFLENCATFSAQSFNFRFGKKINSSNQPWAQFFNSLVNIVFDPDYPSRTLTNVLSLIFFVSFTLASFISVFSILSEIGLVSSSSLPFVFQRFDYSLLVGTVFSLIAGILVSLETSGANRIIEGNKANYRKQRVLGIIAFLVIILSSFSIAGISLKKISLLGGFQFNLVSKAFIDLGILGLPVITTSLGAVLVFDSAVHGLVVTLFFLFLVFLTLLPVFVFLVDVFWRATYVIIDFLEWLLLTPIIAIPHIFGKVLVFLGILSVDREE